MSQGVKHPRSLLNKNAIVILFLAAAAFLVLFAGGVIYELTGDLFGIDTYYIEGLLQFGLNNGLTFSLLCMCILYLFVRMYSLDILISYDGANILWKNSMWIFSVWILNLVIFLTTDYFHAHIFIAIIAAIVFLLSLLMRQTAKRYAQFAATYNTPENFSDINVPLFFSFLEFLFKKEQPPMPPVQ